MKILSSVTIFVTVVLSANYAYQLVLPALTGTKIVTVDLTDPLLEALEFIVLILTLAWLYIGLSDLQYARRMTRTIKDARRAEHELEMRIAGTSFKS